MLLVTPFVFDRMFDLVQYWEYSNLSTLGRKVPAGPPPVWFGTESDLIVEMVHVQG